MATSKGILFTRMLSITGSLFAWFPIVALVVITVVGYLHGGTLHVDYLIPGEFFPAALIGGGLLIWAAIRAGIRRKLVIISLAAAVLMLFGSQALAVATGLATGKMEPVGIWWVIVLGMMGVYTLMVIVLGVAGCLLVKDLFQSGKT